MPDLEIYQKFIAWLEKTWWGLPESNQLVPLIKAATQSSKPLF